jgi:putative hydrolase
MMINQEIVEQLNEIAALLEEQGANPYRVMAYRKAAAVVAGFTQPISEVVERKGFR